MTDTSTAAGTGRTGITRPVLLAGIVLGTTLTILAMWNGVRLRVPDLPSIIGAALGALIVWVLFMAVAAAVSELTVRHHRSALRHGWRYSKRTARAAAIRSRPWRTRLTAALRARWAARTAEPVSPGAGAPLFRRTPKPVSPGTGPEPASGPVPAGPPVPETDPPDPGTGPTYSWGTAKSPYGWPADDAETAHRWARHMSTGEKPHVVTEYPPGGGPGRTIATYVNGKLTEGTEMTETPSPATPAPRSGHRVLTIGGVVPGEWKSLVAITADFEPEDDGDLLAWMASEVNGMSAYAEALTEVYETGVSSVGLDPVSLAALHDTADAAAEAAQAMAGARQKFAAHYAEVREFAAAGGLLPHDGRWITGEGE